ncbi:MAG: hypothetical protein IPL71_16465 [Anaerolineales bacterium]|uniref:hypothetical protein n=1 Tax=Candidatus Villigracilis proximus TaxID=3140683 RepID=UPI003135337D|nr:hypothetical protein [Anaerolineales bacterium]
MIAIWKRAWTINPLWGVYILLNLPILPHLFITWHGTPWPGTSRTFCWLAIGALSLDRNFLFF